MQVSAVATNTMVRLLATTVVYSKWTRFVHICMLLITKRTLIIVVLKATFRVQLGSQSARCAFSTLPNHLRCRAAKRNISQNVIGPNYFYGIRPKHVNGGLAKRNIVLRM